MPFIDPNETFDEVKCKIEPSVEIEELNSKVYLNEAVPTAVEFPIPKFPITTPKASSSKSTRPSTSAQPEPTFDGRWSSDEDDDYDDGFPDSDDEPLSKLKSKRKKKRANIGEDGFPVKVSREGFWSHKSKSLAGKIACKYCDTIFSCKEERQMHVCVYLQCDRRNFICRVCNKELSKKTFSNHLHETLDCQFCKKKFVNPRCMRTHIERQHKGQVFVPPRTYKDRMLEQAEILKKEEIGELPKRPKKKYPRKKEKLECGELKLKFLNSNGTKISSFF